MNLRKCIWQGRIDHATNPACRRWHQVIQTIPLSQLPKTHNKSFVLIGYSSDEGIRRNQGRPGAHLGPTAIRKALANLPVHFDTRHAVFDVGDIKQKTLEATQDALTRCVHTVLTKNAIPIVLGGGHDLAYGHGRALLEYSKKKIGIVNFDAHFDLRPLENGRGTSGTPFLQLAQLCSKTKRPFRYLCLGIQRSGNTPHLFNTAREWDVSFVLQQDLQAHRLSPVKQTIKRFVNSVEALYVTVCLDVFNMAFAPGVSAPSVNGLSPDVFFELFSGLDMKKIIGLDLAEMSPPYDRDGQTARLAALIVDEFIAASPSGAAKTKRD